MLVEYDNVYPLVEVPLWFLNYWLKIFNIPLAYEGPDNIAIVGAMLGVINSLDKKLFKKCEQLMLWEKLKFYINTLGLTRMGFLNPSSLCTAAPLWSLRCLRTRLVFIAKARSSSSFDELST